MCEQMATHCEITPVSDSKGIIIKYQVIVELLPEEYKACMGDMSAVNEWVHNAIYNKARQMIDFYVEKSGLGSRFSPLDRKHEIIQQIDIPAASEVAATLIQ